MKVIAAIVLGQHPGRLVRIAQCPIEIDDRVERVRLPQPLVDFLANRFALRVPRAGKERLVLERSERGDDDLYSRAWPRTAGASAPIICGAVTSSSGLPLRFRRSLVPSMMTAWVTPGCASTSRSKRRRPLSPRISCRIRFPPSPWFITAIGRPLCRAMSRRAS